MESVNAVMLCLVAADIVNAAAGNDQNIGVLADIEIVVNKIRHARFGQKYRDIDALVFGAGLDIDVDAGVVRFGHDFNVLGTAATGCLTVGTDIIGSLGNGLQVGDFPQKIFLHLVQFHFDLSPPYSLPVSTAQVLGCSSPGSTSSRVPSFSIFPPAMTMMRSAIFRMRS